MAGFFCSISTSRSTNGCVRTISGLRWEKCMNIYIGQLPYSVTEDELKAIFSEFGEISSVNIIKDRFSGKSKGFGFIDMPNNADADKAIKALNKSTLNGREIKVNQAEQRKQKARRRPRY